MSNLDKMEQPVADWGVAEAKNKFSELMTRALREGPQRVRRRDEEVVVVSAAEFERMCGTAMDFKKFLLAGPSFEGLDLERDKSGGRDISFLDDPD